MLRRKDRLFWIQWSYMSKECGPLTCLMIGRSLSVRSLILEVLYREWHKWQWCWVTDLLYFSMTMIFFTITNWFYALCTLNKPQSTKKMVENSVVVVKLQCLNVCDRSGLVTWRNAAMAILGIVHHHNYTNSSHGVTRDDPRPARCNVANWTSLWISPMSRSYSLCIIRVKPTLSAYTYQL